jgi:hypothetical protein
MEAVDQLATPPSPQDNINTVVAIEGEAQLRRTMYSVPCQSERYVRNCSNAWV